MRFCQSESLDLNMKCTVKFFSTPCDELDETLRQLSTTFSTASILQKNKPSSGSSPFCDTSVYCMFLFSWTVTSLRSSLVTAVKTDTKEQTTASY
jgi:hypothetical protein